MTTAERKKLKKLLDDKVTLYNRPSFIENDPIQIPHRFTKLQDREILAFWVAMLAWGQRKTIINKANELIDLMDGAPHQFITQHKTNDLKRFESFKHRTFQPTDTLYFIRFFKTFYQNNTTLENVFAKAITPDDVHVGPSLIHFHNTFFSLDEAPHRTKKHVATPVRNSSCKRLNMFLRWMVRKDNCGVDFGLWNKISPAQLLCPLDVHVDRIARRLGLIKRKQTDWKTVLELTENLKMFDADDPVKYDFALFSMGVDLKN